MLSRFLVGVVMMLLSVFRVVMMFMGVCHRFPTCPIP
jgi:hypothetical protein